MRRDRAESLTDSSRPADGAASRAARRGGARDGHPCRPNSTRTTSGAPWADSPSSRPRRIVDAARTAPHVRLHRQRSGRTHRGDRRACRGRPRGTPNSSTGRNCGQCCARARPSWASYSQPHSSHQTQRSPEPKGPGDLLCARRAYGPDASYMGDRTDPAPRPSYRGGSFRRIRIT
jgi:hypothetical protein